VISACLQKYWPMNALDLQFLQVLITGIGVGLAAHFAYRRYRYDNDMFYQHTLKVILEHIGSDDVRRIRRKFQLLGAVTEEKAIQIYNAEVQLKKSANHP
jgi:hypothetical protein